MLNKIIHIPIKIRMRRLHDNIFKAILKQAKTVKDIDRIDDNWEYMQKCIHEETHRWIRSDASTITSTGILGKQKIRIDLSSNRAVKHIAEKVIARMG